MGAGGSKCDNEPLAEGCPAWEEEQKRKAAIEQQRLADEAAAKARADELKRIEAENALKNDQAQREEQAKATQYQERIIQDELVKRQHAEDMQALLQQQKEAQMRSAHGAVNALAAQQVAAGAPAPWALFPANGGNSQGIVWSPAQNAFLRDQQQQQFSDPRVLFLQDQMALGRTLTPTDFGTSMLQPY